ncbi:WEB family protein (DUF827) [Wolffia australiana]
MDERGGGRAEVDTRTPFRSVKEALMLFGEKVLAEQIYASNLNQCPDAPRHASAPSSRILGARKEETRKIEDNTVSSLALIHAELAETRQMLEMARTEGMLMVTALTSLRDELQMTREELMRLKSLKMENGPKEEVNELVSTVESGELKEEEGPSSSEERQEIRRRYVRFAEPPSLVQVINADTPEVFKIQLPEPQLSDSTSVKKHRKAKTLISNLGIIFSSR